MSVAIEERIEIILLCGQIGATNRSVAESFNSSHEGMNISHTTVGRLFTKFKETGSVHDKETSGRPTIADKTRAVIVDKVMQSPKKAVRRFSQDIDICEAEFVMPARKPSAEEYSSLSSAAALFTSLALNAAKSSIPFGRIKRHLKAW